jgi:Lon protease-like protein
MDIQTRGKNRFEIVSLNDEKTYLQAEVNFFEDDDLQQPPEDLRSRVVGHLQSLRQLSSHEGRGEPDLGDPQVSFQVAQFIPDVDFLSAILRQRSEARRLKELNDFLDSYIPKLQATERMRRLAPTNGSGVRPAGL